VVGAEECSERRGVSGNLAEFFANSPLRESGLKVRRLKQGLARLTCELRICGFLLDTNAVSEWVKPRPNPGVIDWMEMACMRIGFSSASFRWQNFATAWSALAAARRRSRLSGGCR